MDTIKAIHRRVSAGKMSDRPVGREIIEKLLEAAVQAPNHYKVRPWRFVVITGQARNRLGDIMAEVFHSKFPELPPEALQKERGKPLRSPVIIAVGVDEPSEPKVQVLENISAAAAACENILLAAEDLGVSVKWRTGDAARDPRVKTFLGFSEQQPVIAFLYIGYVETEAGHPARLGYEDRTRWLD